jgi:hypothetical protein
MENKKISILYTKAVKSMSINSSLYVDKVFFQIFLASKAREKFKVSVYMDKNAVGIDMPVPGLVLVKKIAKDVFDYWFPLDEPYLVNLFSIQPKRGFFPPVIIDLPDVSIKTFKFVDKNEVETNKTEEEVNINKIDDVNQNNNQDVKQDECFDINSFDDYVDDMFDYINGPMFFIDRSVIDEKLELLPGILFDYLCFFKTPEDERLFLDDWIAKRDWFFDDHHDGIRKRYIIKIYNTIIKTIEEDLKDDEELVNEISQEHNLKSFLSNMSQKDLEKKADEAINKKDKETFLKISEELERRDGLEKNKRFLRR